MIKELFEEKFGFTLGERIGTKSSYGEAYVMPTKSKIVKIFYAKSDDLANREIAITTIMGLEGVGPKLFNAGKLDDKHYKLVDRMDALVSKPPSLLRCKSLMVKGPVEFGPGVTVVGTVSLSANDRTRIENRTFEDVELAL